MYADADTICHQTPNLFLSNYYLNVIKYKKNSCDSLFFSQHLFSAPKNSPILKKIIDLSVERIKNTKEFKGEHLVHYLTGPTVFSDGIDHWLLDNKYTISNDKTKYITNIKINFIPETQHCKIVSHLWSGAWNDGWLKERDNKLL